MYNGLLKSFLITLAAFVAVFLLFAPSWSADWEVLPYVTIIEEYNDNIRFSSKGQELDDFVTYVRPRIEAKYSTDRLRMSLNSGLEREIYVDYDELNTTNHDHELDLSYGLSGTLGLRAGGDFREDTTLETELIEEGLLVDLEDRRKFGGNLGFDYAFSTRLSLSGGWTRSYTEYPDGYEVSNYVGTRSDTFELALQPYVLSRRSRLILRMKHTRTERDTEKEVHSYIEKFNPLYGTYHGRKEEYKIWASFHHDLAEDYYISGEVGYHNYKSRMYDYTGPKTESVTKARDEDDESFVFELSFHRNWMRASAELLVYRNRYIDPEGDIIYRNRVALKGTYRFSERFASSVTATFQRNREDDSNDDSDDDSDYYTVSPAFSYDLTPTIILRGSVDYTEYDYKDINRADRERFRARLFLNFTWPRLLSGY